MKQIKVRAWDRTNKVMIEKPYLHLVDGESFYLTEKGSTPRSDLEFELLQFTGLKDKNGKEIYEGDILQSKRTKIIVQWSAYAYGDSVGFGAIGLNGDTEYNINHFSAHGEVIGNIYENKELLK